MFIVSVIGSNNYRIIQKNRSSKKWFRGCW